MSSGNIKYVFTEATAPTGVGEVEGSIWYNTTNKLTYTYDGSTWVVIAAVGGQDHFVPILFPDSVGAGTWARGQRPGNLWYYNISNQSSQNNGDNITTNVWLNEGTYNIQGIASMNTDHGIWEIQIDGTPVATFDCNGSIDEDHEFNEPNVVIASSGYVAIKSNVNGKTGSGYFLRLSRLIFQRTA